MIFNELVQYIYFDKDLKPTKVISRTDFGHGQIDPFILSYSFKFTHGIQEFSFSRPALFDRVKSADTVKLRVRWDSAPEDVIELLDFINDTAYNYASSNYRMRQFIGNEDISKRISDLLYNMNEYDEKTLNEIASTLFEYLSNFEKIKKALKRSHEYVRKLNDVFGYELTPVLAIKYNYNNREIDKVLITMAPVHESTKEQIKHLLFPKHHKWIAEVSYKIYKRDDVSTIYEAYPESVEKIFGKEWYKGKIHKPHKSDIYVSTKGKRIYGRFEIQIPELGITDDKIPMEYIHNVEKDELEMLKARIDDVSAKTFINILRNIIQMTNIMRQNSDDGDKTIDILPGILSERGMKINVSTFAKALMDGIKSSFNVEKIVNEMLNEICK